ncbi:MAG: hypothetical protein Q4D21_01095 [Phascolarctobacterium sp.]|nr:hypothetical protein [Phascolarctobacterium sp.]
MNKTIFSRGGALEKILDVYSRWYILHNESATALKEVDSSDDSCSEITLVSSGRMDEEEGAFVMTRKVVIWEAQSHEYVYFFNVGHLTMVALEKALEESYKRGMECIVPGPEHRCSYIATVIVASSADDEAIRHISKFQKRENFKMSFHGWMDQMVSLVIPEKIIVSPGSKRMEDILEYSLDPEGFKEKRRGIKGFIRKIFR